MKLPFGPDMARHLARMSEEKLRAFLADCTPTDVLLLDSQFEMWAQDGQLPPKQEGWTTWLMMAGRGFGKTRAGAEWIHALAMTGQRRIALVGATIDDARSIMVEGVSGLLSVAKRQRVNVRWEPSKGELRWPNGSIAKLFSGDNPDGLRGAEHDFAWCDELAKWRQPDDAWDNLQFGLRRGSRARALVTTTPKPLALLNRIRALRWTVETGGPTAANINLPKTFVDVMVETYGGTRIGRQELDGELIADAEGALWTKAMIEAARAPLDFARDERMRRIVVGVDPPAGSSTNSGLARQGDACGIVVCGKGEDGNLYVLEDASVGGLRPEGWANRVAAAAARWGASLIVAESNNGGAMVKSVLDAAEAGVRVKLVHASLGKSARAEPVALRFERGRLKLAGSFPELEAQLCGLIAGGGYEGPGRSPDRADAMVWAMTELGETKSGIPRVVRL